jgi:hypothetical protein
MSQVNPRVSECMSACRVNSRLVLNLLVHSEQTNFLLGSCILARCVSYVGAAEVCMHRIFYSQKIRKEEYRSSSII